MTKASEHFLWADKYRPATVAECIMPDRFKFYFGQYAKTGIPNLILSGRSGVGKTTVALAMTKELKADTLFIPATMKGNIDTLRTEVAAFASTVSLRGGRKYVILDEADYLTHVTQPALRNFFDEYGKYCGFILTCNFSDNIIDAVKSRCIEQKFELTKQEIEEMQWQFFEVIERILNENNVKFEPRSIAKWMMKFFPDMRKIITELQSLASAGTITEEALAKVSSIDISEVITALHQKNYMKIRKWVAENVDDEPRKIFRAFYEVGQEHFTEKFAHEDLVLIMGEYGHKAVRCADAEINLSAFLTEVMLRAEWK
jgi:DNA polymerase III delta prime subunit